ncbi:MAG: CoA transferase [Deltaproteobacteria bacterium]|nr:CoA transferase [Deltaproteobacteria bacterium]
MKKALEGIRVADLSHVLAAPTCTMFLADLGAEVIHIEPKNGDDAREIGPYVGGEHDINKSSYFISLNRNKKSLVLNLKSDRGKEILREIIAASDVVVENFRPMTMKKLGFDWPDIQKINPRAIYCSVCGFGHDSLPAYAARPAYDMVAQAYSGIMSITGPEEGPPCRVGSSVGDIIAGHQATIGILAALLHREKTGRGQHLDCSMVDGLFSVLENAVSRYTVTGVVPGPLGGAHASITPFQGFETKDGSWLVAAIGNDNLWAKYCDVIGRSDLTEHPKFKTNVLRSEHKKELMPILSVEMARKTSREWSDIFDEAELPYSPINNIQDICEDPHIAHRNMLVEVDQPRIGKMKIVGSPIKLSETPGEVYAPAPLLGEHSEWVLKKILNYSDKEIQTLKEEGVINRDF